MTATWFKLTHSGTIEEVQITDNKNGMVTVRTTSDSGMTVTRHRGAYSVRGLYPTRAKCIAAHRQWLRDTVRSAEESVKRAQHELKMAKDELRAAK